MRTRKSTDKKRIVAKKRREEEGRKEIKRTIKISYHEFAISVFTIGSFSTYIWGQLMGSQNAQQAFGEFRLSLSFTYLTLTLFYRQV